MVKVVYGDTDSLMWAGCTKEESIELVNHLNNVLEEYTKDNECKNNYLKLEFEEFATRAIMVKKKRYAMKLSDGGYKIAGFQLKRSDTQALTKHVQETILHQILSGKNKDETREYYHRIKDEVLSGEHKYEIGIPRKFTKGLDKYADGTAIRGASYSNQHFDTHIGAGDKCLIYHIKHTGRNEPTDAIALEDDMPIPEGYIIDITKHWERINKALFPLLDDLDILEKTKQQSLEAFL